MAEGCRKRLEARVRH